jgi:hypothetical protein
LPRKPGWTDKFLIFLSGLQEVEQRDKKCNEIRGVPFVQIPSLFAVACNLPCRAND